MPGGICGTWPAFWTIGPDWPANGEIDIIEGVNSQMVNAMTLHTAAGCEINNTGKQRFSGSIKTNNCDTKAPGQGANVGCGISTTDTTTYGDGFNNAGGGVYATEWTASAISVYHFTRANIPSDLASDNPDPTGWGEPLAVFVGCDFSKATNNQTIIFDTTFCGQWAGSDAVWQADAVCSQKAATCQDYVANNPADFADAFWEVNYVKVFQQQDNGYIGQSPIPSQPSSAAPTSQAPLQTFTTVPTSVSIPASRTSHPPFHSMPSPAQGGTNEPSTLTTVPRPHFTKTATVDVTMTMTVDGAGQPKSFDADPATATDSAHRPGERSNGNCTEAASEGCIAEHRKPKGDSCTESASGGCIGEHQKPRPSHTNSAGQRRGVDRRWRVPLQ